jgi:uncharacterized protein (TIGR03067 family)
MRHFVVVMLASLSLAFAAAVQAKDVKPDTEGIQGSWKIVRVENDGKPLPEEASKQVQFVFDGEKVRMVDNSGENKTQEAAFKLDQTKTPKALDLIFLNPPLKGKKVACIYELKGDDLKLVWTDPETQDRPTEFKTAPGSELALYVLKRVK